MCKWEKVKLGDVCYITDGAHAKVERTLSGIMYLTSKNIGYGVLKLDSYDFIHEQSYNKLFSNTSRSQRKLQPDDVLMGIIGSFGNCYLYTSMDNFGISSSIAILRPNKDFIFPKFLYYIISSKYFIETIKSVKGGSVQGYTNIPTIKSLHIPLPPLEEQKRIAAILSSLDDKIEVNNQINKNLEEQAQAIFTSWFVDFEPVKAKMRVETPQSVSTEVARLFPSTLVKSELGIIPEGWEIVKITELIESISKTYPLKEVEKIIFLNTGDIENGIFLHDKFSNVSELPGQAKKSIQKNDFLFSEIRPKNKRFAYVNFDASNYVVSTKLMVLREKKPNMSLFSYFFLTQENILDKLQTLAELRSGTFPQITYKELETISCILPKELTLVEYYINNFLTPYFCNKFSLQKENDELKKIRDHLLPKLMNGEI